MFGKEKRKRFIGIARNGLIRCPKCEQWLDAELFKIAKSRGGTGRQCYCGPCTKLVERGRKHSRQRVENNLLLQRKAYRLNPQKAYQKKEVRRARLAGVPRERVYRDCVYFNWQGLCGICWGFVDPQNWQLDHIIPIARGGGHLYTNVQPAHPFCNQSKGAVYVG